MPAAAAPAAAPIRSRYRKLLDLASGGMGRVELALAQGEGNFARFVALKRLHAPFEHDEQFRAMFFDEARLAGLVHHPNVGAVVDVGRDDVGFYLAMEYVEGQTLAALIIRLRELRQTIPFQLACRIMAQAAHGLAAAHGLTSLTGEKLDLVHRDVSPQNILIGYDGVVKVVDFGVARAAGRMQTTVGTSLKGKLGYMSPEQLSFQSADARSDLFGLGVVLYELLALTRLYRSDDTSDGPRRILTEPAPRLRELRAGVPKELDELGCKLLAKRPEDRPQTAHEVAQTLEHIASALAVKEGGVDVGAFVKARFTREIEERRAAIKSVLDNEDEVITETGSLPLLPDRSSTGASVSLVRPSRPDSSPWRTVAMAALVVGAVIIGATVAIVSTSDDPATPLPSTPLVTPTPSIVAPTSPTAAATAPTAAPTPPTSAPTATTAAPPPPTSAPTPPTSGPLSPNGERVGVRGEAPPSASPPTTSATRPTVSATPPTASATRPTTSATAPTTSATRPTVSAPPPTTSATRPTVSATPPTASATRPTVSATRPTVSAARPTTSATRPTTSAARPTASAATPPRSTATTPPRSTATTPPRSTATPGTRPRTRPRTGVRIWEWP